METNERQEKRQIKTQWATNVIEEMTNIFGAEAAQNIWAAKAYNAKLMKSFHARQLVLDLIELGWLPADWKTLPASQIVYKTGIARGPVSEQLYKECVIMAAAGLKME